MPRWTLAVVAAVVLASVIGGARSGSISAGATSILGDPNIEPGADPSGVGVGEANRFTASGSGTVASLWIYLDGSNRSTQFELGLYVDASGVPGTLLAKGASGAVTSGSWNGVPIAPTAINGGTLYWIARLSTAGGALVTRVNAGIANADRSDTRVVTTLPAAFSAGGSWPHLTSMYAAAPPAPTATPAPSPSPTPTPSSTPIAGSVAFVGDTAVEPTADASSVGQVEANRFVASSSGSVSSLSIYLDATNQATSFALGLFSDSAGVPGSLLAQGSRSSAQNGAWKVVAIPAQDITSGTAYWIARLSTSGGSLVTRVNSTSWNADRVDTRSVTTLPTVFSPGASYMHITSMYAGNTVPSTPGPTPTPTPTAPSGAFTCTEVLGFSQTGNWWSLQVPNAFEYVVDGTRYQLREADGGAIWKWADPSFAGWFGNPTSPCNAYTLAPDRVIMDITESFWIDDYSPHAFDDYGGNPDLSINRVAQDIRNVVSTIRAKHPSVRQIYLKPLVGGPAGGAQCYIIDSSGVSHSIRSIWNSPKIAQAIAMVANGVDVLAAPTLGVRSCADFYDDGQYVGHLSPYNDAKVAIGQMIGAWFAARP